MTLRSKESRNQHLPMPKEMQLHASVSVYKLIRSMCVMSAPIFSMPRKFMGRNAVSLGSTNFS